MTGDVVLVAANQPIDRAQQGKIVVRSGGVSPDRSLAAQRAGVAGLDSGERRRDHPRNDRHDHLGSVRRPRAPSGLPSIPIIHIKKSEGDRLRAAATSARRFSLTTKVEQGWATAPVVVADIPGKTADFVLIATHLDAWYRGMTDTAGSDASILEMARVLQAQQSQLERGVRFAWWPGHSFGRYAGSTWYVDRFWSDLDQHCVAYTNLDGPGRRGSQMDQVSAGGWPGIAEFSREFAQTLTNKTPESRGGRRRTAVPSDSRQRLIVPGPRHSRVLDRRAGTSARPSGSRSRTARSAIGTPPQDTIEKLDPRALGLDTQYRVAQLYSLASVTNLPLKIAPIATSFQKSAWKNSRPRRDRHSI